MCKGKDDVLKKVPKMYHVRQELPDELDVPEPESIAKDYGASFRVSNKSAEERLPVDEHLLNSLRVLQRSVQPIAVDLSKRQSRYQRYVHGGLRRQFL